MILEPQSPLKAMMLPLGKWCSLHQKQASLFVFYSFFKPWLENHFLEAI